jgi:hypothetical protein
MAEYYIMEQDPAGVVSFVGAARSVAGQEVDLHALTWGVPYKGPAPAWIEAEEKYDGPACDVMFGAFKSLIVSERALLDMGPFFPPDGVQVFPVRFKRHEGAYALLNITTVIDCFDTEKSKFDYYVPAPGDKTDRVYETVYKTMIVPDRIRGADLFLIKNWEVAIVVSKRLRDVILTLSHDEIRFDAATE